MGCNCKNIKTKKELKNFYKSNMLIDYSNVIILKILFILLLPVLLLDKFFSRWKKVTG